MRTDIAGRIAVNHHFAFRDMSFVVRRRRDLRNIIADGFRQTRGVYGDDIRIIDRKHIVNGLQQIALTAKDRRPFCKRTGPGHHRLFIMFGQRTAVIGATSLRAVTVRQAPMDAQGRIHRPDRLTGFRRVDRQGTAFFNFFRGMSK